MEEVIRSVALGQNIHKIMPTGGVPPLQPLPLALPNGGGGPLLLGKCPIVPAPAVLVSGDHLAKKQHLSVKGPDQRQKMQGATVKNYPPCCQPYVTQQQSASVQRRNARERNRVKQVNNGFANLRQHIPPTVVTVLTNGTRGTSKKLSKVDTLRLAVEYIRSLERMLEENGGEAALAEGSALAKQHFAAAVEMDARTTTSSGSNTNSSTSTSTTSTSTSTTNQQLSNSSVCSVSSGSTYYGTMSEPSNASSPTPSHLSDSSQCGTPGCYTQITGSFNYEPFDSYIDSGNSPTPSYSSDHGVSGVGDSHQLYATTVLPGQTVLEAGAGGGGGGGDNNNYLQHQQQYHQLQPHYLQQQLQQHYQSQQDQAQAQVQGHHAPAQAQAQVQFKTEVYNDSPYDEELSLQNIDDEELLDTICWWQEK